MALNNIEYGSLASSVLLNENFAYLDNRITETSDSIMTSISSIFSNIATINSRLNDIAEELTKSKEDITTLNDNTNAEIKTCKKDLISTINSSSMLPDWSKCITLSSLNNYKVVTNGFLMFISTMEDVGNLEINGVSMAFKRRTLSYDNSSQLVSFPVKKGDVVTCTCPTIANYFVPAVQYDVTDES